MQDATQAAPESAVAHASDSTVQQRSAQHILELSGQSLGIDLTHQSWPRREQPCLAGRGWTWTATAPTRSSKPRSSPRRAG